VAECVGKVGFFTPVVSTAEIPKTLRNFVFIGLAPAIGAVLLSYIFVKALFNFSDPRLLERAPAVAGGEK
jgi:hypothetical protein